MQFGTRGRGMRAAFVCAGLLWGVTGCRHKPVAPTLPQITQPVPLETPPQPENPPMVEAPPAKLPPVPVASGAATPRRERKKKPAATPTAAQTPVQTAENSPPADVTAIGVLTSGSDSSPRATQEAADLITANEKRVNALPVQKTDDEKAQVTKVRNFLKQAQEALRTGDTEGAKTLATKAKLLLDDIEKL